MFTRPAQQFIASRFQGALIFLLLVGATGHTQNAPAPLPPAAAPDFSPHQILIKPKAGIIPAAFANFHAAQKGEVIRTFEGIGNLQLVRLPKGETVTGLITKYQQSGLVEYAEPDYIMHTAATTPNDPLYLDGTLWGLNNTGQNSGTMDADIDAPEGWDVLNSAGNIVVAVIDTGVRYTHEDLAANMWVNPNDGGHGFNVLNGTNEPNDDNGHGTLVSGILGGLGNNGKGMAGVAWRVQIMACKPLDSTGYGTYSDAIACIDYARSNGARIINASWGGYGYSLSLSNALAEARSAGIMFVAGCGNDAKDIDSAPFYPACYDLDNLVSVAYTSRSDVLGRFSNYGATNVDLAAPGEQMYSTFFRSDSDYFGGAFLSGTSMAAPFVTGTLALLLTKYPTETHQEIIRRLLNATDPLPALSGKCVTGGRLNFQKAIGPPIRLTASLTKVRDSKKINRHKVKKGSLFRLQLSGDANRTYVIQATTNFMTWSPVFTNTTSRNGTFNFTDHHTAKAPQRFYRAVSSP